MEDQKLIVYLMIGGYALLTLIISLYGFKREENTPEDYFLAGRRVGTLVLFFTIVATNFSAFFFLGFAGAGYRIGYSYYGMMAFGTAFVAVAFYLIGHRAWRIGRLHGYISPSELIGKTQKVWVIADDEIDMLVKGHVDRDAPSTDRRISDQMIAWVDALDEKGLVETQINTIFFTNGASREPELAGIAGALAVEGGAAVLAGGGRFLLYGPFSYAGRHTAPSNASFDVWLKARDPQMGIRDVDWLQGLAADAGMVLDEDIAMPVNNRTLVWLKS